MADLVTHKKAHFDFSILETYEAGIELLGLEVKSLRNHKGKLEGAHIVIRGGEAFLLNSEIPPYQPGNTPKDYDAMRNRKLLLNKKELTELATHEEQKGLTIIPLALYSKGNVIKLKIGIAKGKKKGDKRETIKRREAQRDIARAMKHGA